MALSKKHYEQFAERFRNQKEEVEKFTAPDGASRNVALITLRDLAAHMAVDFALDNPRFDRKRFLTACGF